MKKIAFFVLLVSQFSLAQSVQITPANTSTNTPQYLVEHVLLDQACAAVSNIQYQGLCGIGSFDYSGSAFGFSNGLVLRNGRVETSAGSYTDLDMSTFCSGMSDAQLQAISNAYGQTEDILDVTYLSFDFIPTSSALTFNFIFASNEYGTYQCNYADVFAFILTDLSNGTSENLAVIPGTSTPVSVTTIRDEAYNPDCGSMNVDYFDVFSADLWGSAAMNMRGYTVPLHAQSEVTPGQSYNIKLVIGDYIDELYDSAVFIEGGSFIIGNDIPDQTLVCGEESILDIGTVPNAIYEWFFNGNAILNSNSNLLDIADITSGGLGSGIYSVQITLPGSCTYEDTTEVTFTSMEQNAVQPESLLQCAENDLQETAVFDLCIQTDIITNANADYSVLYYTTETDALNHTNPIACSNYTNTSNPQTIYAAMFDANGCTSYTQFDLIVTPLPALPSQPLIYMLCSDEPGGNHATFDLSTIVSDVSGSQNLTDVFFYATLSDAENSTNLISNTTLEVSNQNIYFQLVSEMNCFNIGFVQFDIQSSPMYTQPTPVLGCNIGNGIGTYDLQPSADEILGTQTGSILQFYPSYADANSQINAIPISQWEQYDSSMSNIYFGITDPTTSCVSIGQLGLILQLCEPVIPNAFSPNGDLINDIFTITPLKNIYENYQLTIFNRWGTVVYKGGNEDPFWDGNVNGILNDGKISATYYYILDLKDGEHAPMHGWVYVNP